MNNNFGKCEETKNDEVRFVCTMKKDKEDYLKYSKYVASLNTKRSPIRMIISIVIILGCVAVLLLMQHYYLLTFYLGVLFFAAVITIISKINYKKAAYAIFDSTEKLGDYDTVMSFSNSGFTAENCYCHEKLPYGKLYAIYFTDKFYYIMLSKNQGFYLRKADCPEGFDTFLSDVKNREKL